MAVSVIQKNPETTRYSRVLSPISPGIGRLPSQAEQARPGLLKVVGSVLRATILGALVVGGVLAVLFALVPAVFVTMCLFLPALLPLAIVGLGILTTGAIGTAANT
jgi:hypothetical protein